MTDEFLSMWTVYERPKDHPDAFIARRWIIIRGNGTRATPDMFAATTLEELRALLPPGLYRFGRFQDDDPNIVEVWL